MKEGSVIQELESDMDIEGTKWEHIRHQKSKFFLSLFVVIVGVFSILNFKAGHMVVAYTEALLSITGLIFLTFNTKIRGRLLTHICVAHISILTFVFMFFPAVGDVAYIWVIGLPYFTSYLVGCRYTVLWGGIFAIACVATGIMFKQQGLEVYWGWEKAPYIALAYVVMIIFASYFSLYVDRYIMQLKNMRLKNLDGILALKESEDRYLTLLNHSLNAVGVFRDEKWVYMNPSCLKLIGEEKLDDIIGVSILEYVHPNYKAMVLERVNLMVKTKAKLPKVEQKYLRKDGSVIPVEDQSHPISFDGKESYMITIRDLSEHKQHEEQQKNLERQREHGQRLESLGVLAGGIAHDFNNLLTGISGNAELLRDEVKDVASAEEYLESIDEGCEHAADLCQQMLAYAGKGKYTSEIVDLFELVRSMSTLVLASVPSNIKVNIKVAKKVPLIEGDVSQIKQVILNLIINAADAIGKSTGEIKITIGVFHRHEKFEGLTYSSGDLSQGDYVVLEIKDTGCGMDSEVMKQIFDPFYTTKEQGNGLGLAAVLGIVRSHNGALMVKSDKGDGTVFRVVFPACEQESASRIVETAELKDWTGHGTVLIVDDEESVLKIAERFVSKLDFDVLTAKNGHEGVDMFQEHHANIKAVLVDMTMPIMGGIDAMIEMRKINPDVPIVIVSGYSEVETGQLDGEDQPDDFIRKPFKAKDLKRVLFKLVKVEGQE